MLPAQDAFEALSKKNVRIKGRARAALIVIGIGSDASGKWVAKGDRLWDGRS